MFSFFWIFTQRTYLLTEVSGLPIGPIFKEQAVFVSEYLFLIKPYKPWCRLVILWQSIQKILLRHTIKYMPVSTQGLVDKLSALRSCLFIRPRFILLQAKQWTALWILFALTVCWVNLSAHSLCVLTRPGVCTVVAAHSAVYPVCSHCLVFAHSSCLLTRPCVSLLLQRTELCILSALTAWCLHTVRVCFTVVCFTAVAAHSTVYPVCYHCLVNKLIYTQFTLVYYVRVFVLLQTELFIILWILFALAVC